MSKGIDSVCVTTGTRAEYGLLRPLLREISAAGLRLQVVAAGMHLAHEFGNTYREIEADGHRIDARVDMTLAGDTPAAMAKSIGIGVLGMAQALESLEPDVVVVLGDRVEALASAIGAAAQNRVVAHIHGGDRTRGGLDESMRHAITKFAHLHFAATEQSRDRILRLGEEPWRVHVTGAPGLDSILAAPLPSLDQVAAEIGVELNSPYLVAVQHPVSTEPAAAAEAMEETLAALREIALPTVMIYPNSDAGARSSISVLERYRSAPWLKLVRSISHEGYLALLRGADALVGNSSSGIIEAASFHLPVVNIGRRQDGRERSGNVLDVAHDRKAIAGAIRAARSQEFREAVRKIRNIYGDGTACKRMTIVLKGLEITPELLQKQITY